MRCVVYLPHGYKPKDEAKFVECISGQGGSGTVPFSAASTGMPRILTPQLLLVTFD